MLQCTGCAGNDPTDFKHSHGSIVELIRAGVSVEVPGKVSRRVGGILVDFYVELKSELAQTWRRQHGGGPMM